VLIAPTRISMPGPWPRHRLEEIAVWHSLGTATPWKRPVACMRSATRAARSGPRLSRPASPSFPMAPQAIESLPAASTAALEPSACLSVKRVLPVLSSLQREERCGPVAGSLSRLWAGKRAEKVGWRRWVGPEEPAAIAQPVWIGGISIAASP